MEIRKFICMLMIILGLMHGVMQAQVFNSTNTSNLDVTNSSALSELNTTTASTSFSENVSTMTNDNRTANSNTTPISSFTSAVTNGSAAPSVSVAPTTNVSLVVVTNSSNTTADSNITSTTATLSNISITTAAVLENSTTPRITETIAVSETTVNIMALYVEVDKDLIITISVGGALFVAMLIFVIVYCVRQASRAKYMKKRVNGANDRPTPLEMRLPRFT